MKRTTISYLILAFVLGLTSACTKQRPERNQQGAFDLKAGIHDLIGDNSLRGLDGNSLSAQDLGNGARYIPKSNSILSPLVFELKTGNDIAMASNTDAESIEIEGGTPFFNELYYVDYKTNETFLPLSLPLLGKPNHTYELRYELTENYLKIYKVGDQEDIPYIETTYAREDLVPGKLAVPLYGIPISYFRTEKVLNSNDRETHLRNAFPIRIASAADYARVTHYELRTTDGQEFKALDKSELFPKEFFTSDEWFSTIVVARSRPSEASTVGAVINPGETEFMSALKTRFQITETELVAYDLNIDPDIDIRDRANLVARIRLPIENLEVRLKPEGRHDTGLSEEEHTAKNWQQRNYLRVRWEQLGTDFALSQLGLNLESAVYLGAPSLTNLRISSSFWAFTLRYESAGLEIRFGFRKVSDANKYAYEPKRFYPDDLHFFAYFWGQRQDILNYQNTRYDDLSRMSYVARLNPARDIEFRLSTLSPQTPWMEQAVIKALAIWDKAFELAGTNINIKYNPRRVELGDSRYNIVNIVDSEYETGGLLGYGPSFNDPYTGEIISATSNVYISHMRASAASSIRNYIRWKGGHLDLDRFELTGLRETLEPGAPGGSLGATAGNVRGGVIPNLLVAKVVKPEDGGVPELRYEVPQVPVVSKGNTGFMNRGYRNLYEPDERTLEFMKSPEEIIQKVRSKAFDPSVKQTDPEFYEKWIEPNDLRRSNALCSQDQTFRTSRGVVRAIETKCPEVVSFAEQKIGQTVTTAEDLALVEQCSEKIMYVQFMQTLIHELGHNFGLIHNFRGSTETDPEKYWNAETARAAYGDVLDPDDIEDHEVAVSNSVMDYYSEDAGGGLVQALPGPYDIAAIRFGYTGLIEGKDENGEKGLIQVGNQSIREAVNEDVSRIEPYQQCTDMEVSFDVLCNRHDLGRTPVEIVQNARNLYYDSLVLSNRRFDRRQVAIDGFRRADTILYPVLKMYNFWRIELARVVFPEDPKLANFSTDNGSINRYYQLIQNTAGSNPEFAEVVEKYLPARDEAFNLMMELIFFPNSYCVVNTPEYQAGVKAPASMGLLPGQVLMDLNFIRQKIRDDKSREAFYTVQSCMDMPVREYLSGLGLEVVDEIGLSVDAVQYDPSDNALYRPLDEAGTFGDRFMTTLLFTQRVPTLVEAIERNVDPTFLDEPDLRLMAQTLFEDRIVNGVRPATTLITEDIGEYMQQVAVRRYFGEENLLLNQFFLLKQGLLSGDFQTITRGDRYSALIYREAQAGIFGQNIDGIQWGQFIIRPASPRATFVRVLINELLQAGTLRLAGNQFIPEDVAAVFRDLIVEPLPKDGNQPFMGEDLLELYDRANAAKQVGVQIAAASRNPGLATLIQSYIDNILNMELYVGSLVFGDLVDTKLTLENQLAFWRAQRENFVQKNGGQGSAPTTPQLSPSELVGGFAPTVPGAVTVDPEEVQDPSKEYYEKLTELGKAVYDAMNASLSQMPKLEYKVVTADYDKVIADLETQLKELNLVLRTNSDLDLRQVYQQLQLPLPTQQGVIGRFDTSFRMWEEKSKWASKPYNAQEVEAYEKLIYDLLLTLGQ